MSSTCHLVLLFSAFCNTMTSAEPTVNLVNLGKAGEYAILAKTGISTVPKSTITGDIAVSPIAATAITGFSLTLDSTGQFSKSTQVVASSWHLGQAYAASYGKPISQTLTTAVGAMQNAYTDASKRKNSNANRINIGAGILGVGRDSAKQLTPGVYTFDSDVHLDGDVEFNGTGVYIIQITGNLVQAKNKKVTLSDGAKPEKIFWQVAGVVKVGKGAHMEGIILAKTSALFETHSSLNGRVLTQTACNLQKATITEPDTARRGLRSS